MMLGFSAIASKPIASIQSAPSPSNPSTVSGVSVAPSAATVAGGATQAFSATVQGTNNPSQAVSWSASIGTINGTGIWTAPAATGIPQVATITATSTQDPSFSGTASVTVEAQVAEENTADPRYARPTSDIATGNWHPSSGSDLYAMLDEATPAAADYIYTSSPGACEIALGAVQDPETSSGQVVRYQVWSDAGSSLVVRLKQGAAVIAQWSHASLPSTPTIYAQTLTTEQCDAITDYTNLRFEFEAA